MGDELPPRPLINLGNTCYLNSILQGLARYQCLRRYFIGFPPHLKEGRLTKELRGYVRKAHNRENRESPFAPREILKYIAERAPRFKGRRQQDAHEALMVMFEAIVEEERKSHGKEPTGPPVTILERMITGSLVATIKCDACLEKSERQEEFFDLALPLIPRKQKPEAEPEPAPNVELGQALREPSGGAASSSKPRLDSSTSTMEEIQVPFSAREASVQSSPPPPPPPPPKRKWRNPLRKQSNTTSEPPPPPKPTERTPEEIKRMAERAMALQGAESRGFEPLAGSIREFFKPIVLEGDSAYVCDSCTRKRGKKMRTRAVRTITIRHAPKVLILFFVRFSQGVTGRLTKKAGHVPFDTELVLPCENGPMYYKLIGVTRHGGSLHGGHYTAFTRSDTDRWFLCNDERVSKTTLEKVLKSEAYLLYFERVNDNI